ncbi:MAG: hypothetical protein ACM3IH_03340 [Sphingobacteriales bacterium]
MHILLALVLITADGPTQKVFEQPSIEACWEKAKDIMSKVEAGALSEGGFTGYGAGCVVIGKPDEASKS